MMLRRDREVPTAVRSDARGSYTQRSTPTAPTPVTTHHSMHNSPQLAHHNTPSALPASGQIAPLRLVFAAQLYLNFIFLYALPFRRHTHPNSTAPPYRAPPLPLAPPELRAHLQSTADAGRARAQRGHLLPRGAAPGLPVASHGVTLLTDDVARPRRRPPAPLPPSSARRPRGARRRGPRRSARPCS